MGSSYGPQRIVSLQPSLTVTLDALGELARVVACTKYCAEIVAGVEGGTRLIIADSWSAKLDEILSARPDLVIASVPYRMESLAEIMKSGVAVLAFAPKCLEDVYRDTQFLANIVGAEQRGTALISRMQSEIDAIRQRASVAQSKPRVYCEEWGKPLIHSQRWVAELVEVAGGEFIGTPGAQSTAEAIAASNPDVVLTAWCGAGDRVPLERIVAQRGWQSLRSAVEGRIYCINDEFLNTPAITLLSGLRAMASALHPTIFGEAAPGLRRIAR